MNTLFCCYLERVSCVLFWLLSLMLASQWCITWCQHASPLMQHNCSHLPTYACLCEVSSVMSMLLLMLLWKPAANKTACSSSVAAVFSSLLTLMTEAVAAVAPVLCNCHWTPGGTQVPVAWHALHWPWPHILTFLWIKTFWVLLFSKNSLASFPHSWFLVLSRMDLCNSFIHIKIKFHVNKGGHILHLISFFL